ncbi:MAG TPA: CRISPR-associated ring nuclease Csm6 [Syntrophorhabdaceae bacterium]|nr:CRISPR-associated ring nuclease Csm6 [Syntrophorhabdaceae bacterium]
MVKRFREILIAVTGLTPQVITETIYALSQKKPPVIIDEICIITTTAGKKIIEDALVKKGILNQLISEYNLKSIEITERSFIIGKDNNRTEIVDIITESDNEIIGDIITSTIKRFASDPETRLHCSIAGGRKTMSFYLGAALQLFGRPQDRLYHVLVNPDFESNPNFFYKPKRNRTIEVKLKDGGIKRLNTRDAKIQLAELPFIRLGDKLSLKGKSFRELVEEGQKDIDMATTQPEIYIALDKRLIKIGKNIVRLPPVQLMVYAALLKQKTVRCKYIERSYCLDCCECFIAINELINDKNLMDFYLNIYQGNMERKEKLERSWKKKDIPSDLVRQIISKINKTLKDCLSETSIIPYALVKNVKEYGSTRYGIKIEKDKINIE